MAKLNGVQTLNMQDGDITKVSYQGEEYTKVDGEAVAGDVLLRISHTMHKSVVKGNFYAGTSPGKYRAEAGRTWYIDEEGDRVHGYSRRFEVFRKSPAAVSPPFAEMITTKVSAVEERVSALEDAKKEPVESAKSTPTFNEGDRVKALRDGEYGRVLAGDVGRVMPTCADASADPYHIRFESDGDSDYFRPQDLELAPEEVQPEPVVGDIVVITGNTNNSRNKVGDIGKASKPGITTMAVDVPNKPRGTGNGNRTKFTEMRPATFSEKVDYELFARIERKKADKDAIFTKAGRKPNEYRKGDLVRVIHEFGSSLPEGAITEIRRGNNGSGTVNDGKFVYRSRDVEIVCFAEDRKDKSKDKSKGGR